ncbi:hypothetical protein IVB14_06270 [Bradyrhizobium sp. 180]|uniref:hypothetical protein n=1 Tax=Bradyrhizobium sp. 180 TaxID=2782650 RepID=UPI001FF7011E|nr:hypothetical protein [Bradyrhizobium sp. 180]MCK1490042.1 hypothetical protein [Bradyrhizobium sp. 180]
MIRTYPVLCELNPHRAQATSAESLASLIWLTLGALLGSAMGTSAGAVVIAHGAVERLGWVAAGLALAALPSVLLSGSGTSGRR